MKMVMPFVIAVALVWQQAPTQSDEPRNPQELVSPAEYRNIPKEVRLFLEQRHCQLPEAKNYDNHPVDVVSGQFAQADQTDWAALCVVNDRARVVVLWGGKTGCSGEAHSGWPLQGAFSKEPAGGLYWVGLHSVLVLPSGGCQVTLRKVPSPCFQRSSQSVIPAVEKPKQGEDRDHLQYLVVVKVTAYFRELTIPDPVNLLYFYEIGRATRLD